MTCVAFPIEAERIDLRDVAVKFRVKYRSAKGWHARGIKVNGEYVKLEVERIGATLYTTWDAVQRFIKAINAPPPGKPERFPRIGRPPGPLVRRRPANGKPTGPAAP